MPEDLIRKHFEIGPLSASLDGSYNDEIMCLKYGPFEDLFVCYREGILIMILLKDRSLEKDICLEDVPELSIDPDDSGEDVDVIMD